MKNTKDLKEILERLEDLKNLFIIFLQSLEVSNKDIAKALGVSSGRVSQIVNRRKYK